MSRTARIARALTIGYGYQAVVAATGLLLTPQPRGSRRTDRLPEDASLADLGAGRSAHRSSFYMSETVRIYINTKPVDVQPSATALDAIEAWDETQAAAVRRGERMITDSRGIVTGAGDALVHSPEFAGPARRPRGTGEDGQTRVADHAGDIAGAILAAVVHQDDPRWAGIGLRQQRPESTADERRLIPRGNDHGDRSRARSSIDSLMPANPSPMIMPP